MNKLLTKVCASACGFFTVLATTTPVFAAETSEIAAKASGASLAILGGSAAGAIAMGMAVAKAVEAISKQPEATSKIQTVLMLGLVFIETAIIYALIIAILVIFVL